MPFQVFGQEHFLRFLSEESAWIEKGACQSLRLTFEIAEGYYIQSAQVLNENFIPTQLTLNADVSVSVQQILYPISSFILVGESEKVAVFKGKFEIWLELETKIRELEATLFYQACNKQKCFFPRSLVVKLGETKPVKLSKRHLHSAQFPESPGQHP